LASFVAKARKGSAAEFIKVHLLIDEPETVKWYGFTNRRIHLVYLIIFLKTEEAEESTFSREKCRSFNGECW
jgi:hypothetical protein